MTKTPEIGDNSNSVTGDELRSFVERIERVEAEVKDLNEGKSEIYGEIKSRGYDAKIVKQIVSLRRRDSATRQEEEVILDLYKSALGMV